MRKISLLSIMAAGLMGLSVNAADYYLIGDLNGWAVADANLKFTEGSDGNYILDVAELKSNFKINDGTWSNPDANFGGSSKLEVGQEYALEVGGSSGNIFTVDNATVRDAKLTFNPVRKTLLVTGTTEEVDNSLKFFADLDEGGWKEYELTDDGYTFTITKSAYFTLTTGSWAGAWRPEGGADVSIEADGSFTAIPSGSNGCYNITVPGTYTIKVEDAETCKFSISGFSGEVIIPDYRDLYLVGDVYGWVDVNDAYMLTREDNVYTITLPAGIAKAEGQETTGWKIWDGSWDYSFGANNAEGKIEWNADNEVWFNSNSNFTATSECETVITLTVTEGSDKSGSSIPAILVVTIPAAVESIEAEGALGDSIRYFNLQGVEINEPENGIFVRVADGKATKVVK